MQLTGPQPVPFESAALRARPGNLHCKPARLVILMHKCIRELLALEQEIMSSHLMLEKGLPA